MYVELHTSSAFSFLEAASLPEALVDRAAHYGYRALALVDRDGVYGAPRFHRAALAAGIRPIIGSELTFSPSLRIPVLVESQEGYQNLCRLVTRMKMRAPKGEGALGLDDLEGHTGGLVALAGRELLSAARYGVGGLIDPLIGLFGRSNVYIELQRHLLRDEEVDNRTLADLAAAFHVPIVATNGVRFAGPAERPLFDVLTCIRHKTDLARAGRMLARNAERYLKPPQDMAQLFHDLPGALAATEALAERLQYTMADLGYRFPEYPVPPGETAISFLRQLAGLGARDRYRPYHERAQAQVERELDLIERLNLAGYFLIVWDIVNFCRQHDILVQGRGSAANSAVCYSLGITAVDPVGMDLLFERFLSEERGEWPDIDLDLPSGDRREQVIQHVYEKYGQLGAAMTANVITYRGRSAAREVGKTLGIDPDQVDRLAKVMNQFEFVDPADTLGRRMADAGCDLAHPTFRLFADLWQRIQDLPRHLGQHSGGMVICQGRLDSVVPLENASMPNRVVIQWDKDDCADMGIVKVDLLGLGMMAVLQDAMELVNGSGQILDLAHLPPDDPDVYRLMQDADTIGVFQVESRAQMATLPRLHPERFYDLVVEVAIIRPGPIVGQMVHPFLNRRAGREPVTYSHPLLEPILARTLGVPLFQEQLLRMAMVTAGFSGGQAEELRRAFGFKRSERRMKQVEVQLREGMAKQGIAGEAAEQIISSITAFALYGFPESHAASFALLAYASAYLKVHFPSAFYTAMLNNQPMGFYAPATLVKDAQRRGVRFTGIDVQHSGWLCKVEPDGAIRLGLRYVSGLREEAGKAIERSGSGIRLPRAAAAREAPAICPKCGCDDRTMLEVVRPGAFFCNTCAHDWTCPSHSRPDSHRFSSVDDLVNRTGLRREELQTLADIGAFASFGFERREALWQVEKAVRPAGELFGPAVESPESAVESPDPGAQSPEREVCPLPAMSVEERLVADYAGMHLTIGPHPMAMRRTELAMRGVLRASDLPRAPNGRRIRVAGTVITRQRPGTAKGFVFLTLEDETGIANIIIRPDLFARERFKILEEPMLLIDGVLQNQDGVTSVKAERLHGLGGAAIEVDSHDFH
ncbi:MAG TPA: error-prone DNA polymerase [Vicinamibacterales bacterium]|jgi:error-prone DNA polymerase|nr:error-prone DNA polymerase [Vicinamibacterales bacterium]